MLAEDNTIQILMTTLLGLYQRFKVFSLLFPSLLIGDNSPIFYQCFHVCKGKRFREKPYLCRIKKYDSVMDFPHVDLPVDIIAWTDVTEDILNIYKQSCRLKACIFAVCIEGTITVSITSRSILLSRLLCIAGPHYHRLSYTGHRNDPTHSGRYALRRGQAIQRCPHARRPDAKPKRRNLP